MSDWLYAEINSEGYFIVPTVRFVSMRISPVAICQCLQCVASHLCPGPLLSSQGLSDILWTHFYLWYRPEKIEKYASVSVLSTAGEFFQTMWPDQDKLLALVISNVLPHELFPLLLPSSWWSSWWGNWGPETWGLKALSTCLHMLYWDKQPREKHVWTVGDVFNEM